MAAIGFALDSVKRGATFQVKRKVAEKATAGAVAYSVAEQATARAVAYSDAKQIGDGARRRLASS